MNLDLSGKKCEMVTTNVAANANDASICRGENLYSNKNKTSVGYCESLSLLTLHDTLLGVAQLT